MNEVQRYNLQKGIKEDRRFEHTTYIPESELDYYIRSQQELRDKLKDKRNHDNLIKELSSEVLVEVRKQLQDVIQDVVRTITK